MEQHDKQHLQNIDKVDYHIHNHIDTAEILSLLNTLKLQNNKILNLLQSSDEELEKQMDEWLVRLNKSVDVIKTVSDQVK